MKHKKYKIDLSGWCFMDGKLSRIIEDEIRDGVETVLDNALKKDNTYMYFPATWGDTDGIGGKSPKDPLTMCLRVGLESFGNKPTYVFNLKDAIRSNIEQCAEDGSFSEGLSKISVELRKLADKIDKAVKKHSD